jgi:hypothetical protein
MMQLDGLAGFDDQPTGARRDAVNGVLNFLWLELTNRGMESGAGLYEMATGAGK